MTVRQDTLDELGATLSRPDQLRVLEALDSNATTKRALRPVDAAQPAFHASYGKLWTRGDDADVVVMVNKLPRPPRASATSWSSPRTAAPRTPGR